MPTTDRGYPYFLTLTDPPDGGSQSEAMMQSINDDLNATQITESSVFVGRSTALTLPSQTATAPASFDLGVLFQRGTDVVYLGSGVIGVKKPGLYWWHNTTNWPDTTLVHRRKVSVQVNGTNFGTGARTSWIFGAAGGDSDTAGGLIPISQANVDANTDGAHVNLELYQSSSASMTGTVPASFGLVRVG